jgi:uncharacterized membrane protein
MKLFARFLFILTIFIVGFSPSLTQAQTSQPVTDDCIIRDFQSQINVSNNNSVDIIENLLVDCGKLPDKHGIFRVLPTKMARPNHASPVHLKSITNNAGKDIKYETLTNKNDHTVTWKIGDPNILIQGMQEYRIEYSVDRAVIALTNGSQWYWNLNGNFWDLPIDDFKATITYPSEVNRDFIITDLYAGTFGNSDSSFVHAFWPAPNILEVSSSQPLARREGITIKQMFPPGMLPGYSLTWFDSYGIYLWFILVPLTYLLVYNVWKKHGQDPKLGYPDVVAFAPPEGLRPFELGMVETYGGMRNRFLAATIVDLAVRKYLKIEELPKQGMFGKSDWRLTRTDKSESDLKEYEKMFVNALFESDDKSIVLKDLQNKFYKHIEPIRSKAYKSVVAAGLIDDAASNYKAILIGEIIALGGISWLITSFYGFMGPFIISVIASGIILIGFTMLMSRRTEKGAKIMHEIEGFRLYMGKAEKYRSQFFEKENIFEQYLPYAILFNLTDRWIKASQKLLQQEHPNYTYAPYWYSSPGSVHAFNPGSFTQSMNSVSSAIGASLSSSPSSSGGGGGGFSGGGGGGGGGGSW